MAGDWHTVTDEWFDGDHPNDLHPIGLWLDPRTREVGLDGWLTVGVGGRVLVEAGRAVATAEPSS